MLFLLLCTRPSPRTAARTRHAAADVLEGGDELPAGQEDVDPERHHERHEAHRGVGDEQGQERARIVNSSLLGGNAPLSPGERRTFGWRIREIDAALP